MDLEILSFLDNIGRIFCFDCGFLEVGLVMELCYNWFKVGYLFGFIEVFVNLYVDIVIDVCCYWNGCLDMNEFVYGLLNVVEGMLFFEKVLEFFKMNKWVLIWGYNLVYLVVLDFIIF